MNSPSGHGGTRRVIILGAGLAGSLLAVMLARRGTETLVLERRPDPRDYALDGGRSINLALAARGLDALAHAGLRAHIAPLLLPMAGRQVHAHGDDAGVFMPYGQRADEVIHSVSRQALNRRLLDAAAATGRASLRFDQRCVDLDPDTATLTLETANGERYRERAALVVACDGAGSLVRTALADAGLCRVREERLAHDYKELELPAADDGSHQLDPGALHIWPRGGFMLIALPNTDGSFTCTLFLARSGEPGFDTLRDAAAVSAFFEREFPDISARMPDVVEQFLAHPQGRLGTVYCRPWTHDGRIVLLGDAAHAIVPFHGQGMNCAFEDCRDLDRLLATHATGEALVAFEQRRKPDADAIAQMALENYEEMRDAVRDPVFALQRELAFDLERRHPRRFVPRYSMVMFRPELGYAQALSRGAIQQRILDELTARARTIDDVDLAHAAALIEARLPPLDDA